MLPGSHPVQRLRLLAAICVAAGLVSAVVCLARQRNDWPFALEFSFMAGFSSQMLLLGIIAGFGGMRWRQRIAAFLAGWAYLLFLAIAPQPFGWRSAEFVLVMCGLVTLPMTSVTGGLLLISRRTRQVIRLMDDQDSSNVLPCQFSIRHLLYWMLGVSVALGFASMIRGNALFVEIGFGVLIIGLAFGLTALVIVWLVVWAALGRGNPFVRLLFVIFASGTLGFIPPYLMTDSPDWRYALWPGLTSATAAIVAATLLIARRLGYRLVRDEVLAPRPVIQQSVRVDERQPSDPFQLKRFDSGSSNPGMTSPPSTVSTAE